MVSEALLAYAATLSAQGSDLYVNDSNAVTVGLDISEIRTKFLENSGRIILTNENIKVRFDQEGKHLDFSTFDNYSIRVNYNEQKVSPNKGGDGFSGG